MRHITLAILAAVALPAAAQLTRGSISGAIEDAAGAIIEGVRIAATNRNTGIRAAAETNSVGVYRFAAVEPGAYDVEYSKDGFQPLRIENIEVGAAQGIVLNRSMAVTSVATDITVVAATNAAELSKATATLERRYSQLLREGLPLSGTGYEYWELALLAPTAARVSNGIPSRRISINGQRSASTNFMIDGVDNNEFFLSIPAQYPSREEIADVQVQTSSYSAEFGRNSAQFSIVTRSGTNQLHGEAWDYYSGNRLNAAALADKQAELNSVRSIRNYFGTGLGGPVIKNRTFFYLTAYATTLRNGPTVGAAMPVILPTPGGFAALRNIPLGPGQAAASRNTILDALSFLPEIHREIRRYENVRPAIVNGVPVEMGSARIPFDNSIDSPAVSMRLDHQLTPKDWVTIRLYGSQQFTPNTDAFATNLSFGPRFSTSQFARGRNYALSYMRTLSSRWTNEAKMAYNYFDLDYRNKTEETSTVIVNLFALGPSFLAPSRTITATTQFQDGVTWLSGRHTWKAGVDLRSLWFSQVLANALRGAWVFPGFGEFLNNQAGQLRQFVGKPAFETRMPTQYYFLQDDFKITPSLTLNVGVRYESSAVPFGFFGATRPEMAAIGVPAPVRPDRNNWAPRAGFAYSPAAKEGWLHRALGNGQTVFRGGFGIAYNALLQQIIDTRNNYPRAQLLLTFPPESFQLYPRLKPKPPGDLPLNPLADFTNLPTDAQNPTTHFYSVSIQRQFGHHIAEFGYSGSRGYHLTRRGDANPAVLTAAQAREAIGGGTIPPVSARRLNPAWGARAIVDPGASSYYNALFLRLDRRFARGLLVGANYTYSSNFTENDDEPPQSYSCFRCDYARSNLDRPSRLAVHYLYQIPWFAGGSKALRSACSGWQVTGLSEWQSGQPFTVTTGVDSVGSGVNLLPMGSPGLFPTFTARPDYNAGGMYALDPVTGDWRSFTTPLDGTGLFVAPQRANGGILPNSMPSGGNLGRNTFRGPLLWNCNVSLMKTFEITERVKLDLRGEWTNLLNHRNFGPPVSDMNSVDFGRNSSNPASRSTQVVAKLRF
ncbi:MAG TPA: carboxypeptidase regulatory-like domain-containing protein [Bryobacteraceae bacterium]|nr:carboxypeptidase regulatory-like domain-containing protein [Bryobacteraceae bacterium]